MKFPEQYRSKMTGTYWESNTGDTFGLFIVPAIEAKGRALQIIASDSTNTGWDHVSVSLREIQFLKTLPSWEEMCLVKDLFWDDSDCVVQYHPAKDDYVNLHEVLHLWKYSKPFPMPPKICV